MLMLSCLGILVLESCRGSIKIICGIVGIKNLGSKVMTATTAPLQAMPLEVCGFFTQARWPDFRGSLQRLLPLMYLMGDDLTLAMFTWSPGHPKAGMVSEVQLYAMVDQAAAALDAIEFNVLVAQCRIVSTLWRKSIRVDII
jgi:hypothetical protein